mmetsp:Transcript_1072/g.1917  ORF Transcript_1072/g.1917 Transcript_1072/m.1917 type:complete len:462 (+) Transcript_1072:125-1510(+)|eukprot:CAMPEP_0176484648 /NCGR_PEP_ID=MMETSP0200_2-20121128/4569_1 /TAXON_ID=947934 /ORGANISM="Chaetoceros sp., Strain GSL56" /LENGTH=461 /DNA_ID=CAMNT_0017881141 /DNA_START=21 /DNA_END=1406 /DNA_ORIENTATION=+
MKGFFEKLQNKQPKASSNHRGGGKALGGNKAGIVLPITLVSPGPLGIMIENTNESSAIVAKVTPGSAAESAGLQRGDIFCFSGTQGKEEIPYRMFLDMIRSNTRPIVVDVRRITVSSLSSRNSSQHSSSVSASSASTFTSTSTSVMRADAEARRQAVIAAAEARDKQHKDSKKPIRKGLGAAVSELTKEQREKIQMQREKLAEINAETMAKEPLSEEAKKAVQDAKRIEAMHAAELGYNPYETMKGTGKQASSVVTTIQHGSLKSHPSDNDDNGGGDAAEEYNKKKKQQQQRQQQQRQQQQHSNHGMMESIDPTFDEAFAVLVSNTTGSSSSKDEQPINAVKKSLRVMRKLIQNATVPGQSDDKKRVRLSNPNPHIEAAIHNVNGALDLMMSVGFVIMEEVVVEEEEEEDSKKMQDAGGSSQSLETHPSSTETYLIYPAENVVPDWLSKALKQMEDYENQL